MLIDVSTTGKPRQDRLDQMRSHIIAAIDLIAVEKSWLTEHVSKPFFKDAAACTVCGEWAKEGSDLLNAKIMTLLEVLDFGAYNLKITEIDENIRLQKD